MTIFQWRNELPDNCAMYTASSLKPNDWYFWITIILRFGIFVGFCCLDCFYFTSHGWVIPKILHECLSWHSWPEPTFSCWETGWTVPPMHFACKWRGEFWTELWGSIRECIKGGTSQNWLGFFINHFSVLLGSRTLETSTYGYKREKGRIVRVTISCVLIFHECLAYWKP